MGDVSAMIDKVSVGDDVMVFANISNTGDKDAADFDVCLYRGETLVSKTHVDELAAGQNIDVELKDAPNSDAALSSLYHAEIAWDSDEEASGQCVEECCRHSPSRSSVREGRQG